MELVNETMLDIYIFETTQMLEQLEKLTISKEKDGIFTEKDIHEIFRIMHTIKGSSSMMMYQNITSYSHTLEDLFFFIREEKPENTNLMDISDFILNFIDFVNIELLKIMAGNPSDGNADQRIAELRSYLSGLKMERAKKNCNESKLTKEFQGYFEIEDNQSLELTSCTFKAVIYFEDGCEMENIRAFTIIHKLKEFNTECFYFPSDLIDSDESTNEIRKNGFHIFFKTDQSLSDLKNFFSNTIFLKDYELIRITEQDFKDRYKKQNDIALKRDENAKREWMPENNKMQRNSGNEENSPSKVQSIISVNVSKLDILMDLVGEMVIAEDMVVQNPELRDIELDSFYKAARQLNKITSEIQDMVMSIRMVTIAATFQKMHRITRDMCRQLNKEIELKIIGQETEVDKNIIEHISDPLMHLVRNAVDHGIESPEVRKRKGKQETGNITLEARNGGSDVLITVKDDGNGLNKERIYEKAKEKGLVYKNREEMTEKEIFNLILRPGFSTKEEVTEFSGRGVGMDVVAKNIEAMGGTIIIDSLPENGSVFTIKIPLTLAIIDSMIIKVGESYFTIPTISIQEAIRPEKQHIITDPDGNEMLMVRGKCYPILRLHEKYQLSTEIVDMTEGIIIIVEQGNHVLCLFADELIGQQQVVVKSLPLYIQNMKKVKGISGCTLLGDGNISLILNIGELVRKWV